MQARRTKLRRGKPQKGHKCAAVGEAYAHQTRQRGALESSNAGTRCQWYGNPVATLHTPYSGPLHLPHECRMMREGIVHGACALSLPLRAYLQIADFYPPPRLFVHIPWGPLKEQMSCSLLTQRPPCTLH